MNYENHMLEQTFIGVISIDNLIIVNRIGTSSVSRDNPPVAGEPSPTTSTSQLLKDTVVYIF